MTVSTTTMPTTMPTTRVGATIRRAFTLVEILIVVIILGILSAITFTTFGHAAEDAAAGAAASDLRHIQTQVVIMAQQNNGVYPPAITDALLRTWFGAVRPHPYALGTTPLGVETDGSGDPLVTHPADKTVNGALQGWWYNPASGVVRSRVKDTGDAGKTLELYRHVNATSIGGLGDLN